MSDLNWSGNAAHPALSLLLLHIEGELDGENAKTVAAHVTHCWECRTSCEHLSQGIFQYMEFETAEPLPPPPSDRDGFHGALLQVARETSAPRAHPNYISRICSGMLSAFTLRWRFVASAVVLVLVSIVFLTMSSRNIAAGEVLNHAVSASKALSLNAPGRAIYEKILIRHGNISFERTVTRGVGVPESATDTVNSDAEQVMSIAGINWADPLNASDFSAWRTSLHSRTDRVSQSDAEITVNTSTSDVGPVRDASLTVQRNDWRPIRKHVEFSHGDPLDITEVSFEIRTVSTAVPIETSRLNPAPGPGLSGPSESKSPPPPSDEQLEDAELRLREVFHSIGADVLDSPVIWREGDRVLYRFYPDSSGRREELLRAVATIPFTGEAPSDPRAPLGNNPAVAAVQQLTTPFTTVPPLADDLATSLGGLDNAGKYLASLRENYGKLLSESTALQRLGQRYTPEVVVRLGPGPGARISALAGDHLMKVNREISAYRQKLLPVLADMLRAGRLNPGSLPHVAVGTCRPWQDAGAAVTSDAKALNSGFMALFVQNQVDRPTQLDTERLLRDSEQLEDALRRDIETVCHLP